MAETITHKGKSYLMVTSIKGRMCDNCAFGEASPRCPLHARGGLVCTSHSDSTNRILIENTPEALAEHFAWKTTNG